jgi:hypothetical protein
MKKRLEDGERKKEGERLLFQKQMKRIVKCCGWVVEGWIIGRVLK